MKSKILVVLFGVLSFIAGSIWGKLNFVATEIYVSDNEIEVKSKHGNIGKIPSGTELHFHSTAHSATKYFLFIEVPAEESAIKIQASEFDSYGGIKPLMSKRPF